MDQSYPRDEAAGWINRARDDIKLLWQAFEENDADELVKEITADEMRAAILITQLVSVVHNLYEAGDADGKAYVLALLHPLED